jgi:putative membrane protein
MTKDGDRNEANAPARAATAAVREEHDQRATNPDPTAHDLAEDRTAWARRRTLLAKERTFSGWVRTGLSAIAVGFGAARLLGDLEPQWLVLAAGAALIVIGVGALGIGFWSYRATLRELEREGIRGLPTWLVGALTAGLVVVALAGLALVYLN